MKCIILFLLLPLLLFATGSIAQTGNRPSKTTSRSSIPSGPHVFGVFDGRTSCQEIARELNITVSPRCHKIKWRVILYQDPITREPTSCEIKGPFAMGPDSKTRWTIERGTTSDPDAVVFHLAPGHPKSLYLLKGDDNVLFFLDKHKEIMVGNRDFGYTLNRIAN